jgi:large subunit ribosomal protein L17
MFRNMVTSLFKHERIRTTDAKAKEIRRWADKLVTLAKRGDLHARRQALSIIREKDVVHKLFAEAPERFAQVNGGYTRVVKVGYRPGDAAAISMVELVTPEVKKKKARRKKKAQKAAVPPTTAPQAVTPEAREAVPPATDDAPLTPEATTKPVEAQEQEAAAAETASQEAAPREDSPETAAESAAEAAPAESAAEDTANAATDNATPKKDG